MIRVRDQGSKITRIMMSTDKSLISLGLPNECTLYNYGKCLNMCTCVPVPVAVHEVMSMHGFYAKVNKRGYQFLFTDSKTTK